MSRRHPFFFAEKTFPDFLRTYFCEDQIQEVSEWAIQQYFPDI